MAGIYIHIPFCRQKCYYCDFYKTVNTGLTKNFLEALKKEILLRKNYLGEERIETIYFGGGTPSVLLVSEISEIIEFLYKEFNLADNCEITFEANPDDLNKYYLEDLNKIGINRLSIGIQSFQDRYLIKMNRRHNEVQAVDSVESARKAGFKNISVDLIYGLPGLKEKEWISDLTKVFQLQVQHLSAYHLTYHQGTPFYTWLKNGTLKELNETESILQFKHLLNLADRHGFEQYEISNFAINEMYSKHNTAYWLGKNYMGLGPSSHSFNGNSRQWNIAHVENYIGSIERGSGYFEKEQLSDNEMFNEYILTHIRTKWGVSSQIIAQRFGEIKRKQFVNNFKKYSNTDLVKEQNGTITLTRKGLFVSDKIMTDLMII